MPRPCPAGPLPIAVLLVGLLNGCGGEPRGPAWPAAMTDPGREAVEAIALPAGNITGAVPQAVARTLFGSTEPVEGDYAEETLTLSDSGDTRVLLFTQLGLPDDSVRGMRHRLELRKQGAAWQLTWAGRQVTCWPGRGQEDWGTAPCR